MIRAEEGALVEVRAGRGATVALTLLDGPQTLRLDAEDTEQGIAHAEAAVVVDGTAPALSIGAPRGVVEAILWHGGEAAPAAERFRALPAPDRAALEAFLRSL